MIAQPGRKIVSLCIQWQSLALAPFTMPAMNFFAAGPKRSIRFAIAASLAIHLTLLLIPLATPPQREPARTAPLSASLRPPPASARLEPAKPMPATERVLTVPPRPGQRAERRQTAKAAAKSPQWTAAERADMNRFLNDLASPARPRSGQELAHNALASAREIGREIERQQTEAEEGASRRAANSTPASRLSLEMYFDALVKKLNRSAGFVKNDPRSKGVKAAAVQIQLNADGSLHSFRILSAADQQSEIDYIKQVVERAVPFSAFPSDLRQQLGTAPGALGILICIQPSYLGGGFGFTRNNGRDCRE